MRIAVLGLWHLGCVTAAGLAAAGHDAVGVDADAAVVADLAAGRPPIEEPGLADLISAGLAAGRLRFTADAGDALADAALLWVAFDTPVNERDEADVGFVRARLEAIAPFIRPGTIVLISSQVPVGFTRALARDWSGRGLGFAYVPENLRLGKAIAAFRSQDRIVAGVDGDEARRVLEPLLSPLCQSIEWMSIESAEMTKHALNAFLATSVTFINEIARLCEATGADAKEVERGLKSEARIGRRAYLAPGAAFAGGTLARDVRYLVSFGREFHRGTPLFDGVLASNELQARWARDAVGAWLDRLDGAVVAILGLTYTAGTSTLRRSASVELAEWLSDQGARIRAFDPAVRSLPPEVSRVVTLASSARDALAGADVAVVATAWPEFRSLTADVFVDVMRHPRVIDQNWFLADLLASDRRMRYAAAGGSTR